MRETLPRALELMFGHEDGYSNVKTDSVRAPEGASTVSPAYAAWSSIAFSTGAWE